MCVFFGGGVLLRWEALPPILLLLKSSHEHPCQELQCGLSRLSQRQSRLRDATTHTHTADLSSFCCYCCSGHSGHGADKTNVSWKKRRNSRVEILPKLTDSKWNIWKLRLWRKWWKACIHECGLTCLKGRQCNWRSVVKKKKKTGLRVNLPKVNAEKIQVWLKIPFGATLTELTTGKSNIKVTISTFWKLSWWYTTRWSPLSLRKPATGEQTLPLKESCGDTPAAEGETKWKATVVVCAYWLLT